MPKIERVEVSITELSTRLQRKLSSGAADTGPAGAPLGKPVLVRIFSDGIIGSGQIRPVSPGHFSAESVHSVFSAVRDYYAPMMIGRSIFDIDQLWSDFDRILPANPNARAAIDCALHDAMGQALGAPVHQMLGGMCQERVPMEWSISMADDPSAMVDDALHAIGELKVSALCLKAGSPGGWQEDARNFEAVRTAVGPDVTIAIDPNTAWTVAETIRLIERLVDLNVEYIEQPINRFDIPGLRQIRSASHGVPIAADESLFTRRDAYDLARQEAVDILCLKIYKMGGIREAKRIADFAATTNLHVTLGGLAIQSQLEAASSAHLFSSIPGSLLMSGAEFLFGVGLGGTDPLVDEMSLVVKDGHVDVPTTPGLGIKISSAAVARCAIVSDVIS